VKLKLINSVPFFSRKIIAGIFKDLQGRVREMYEIFRYLFIYYFAVFLLLLLEVAVILKKIVKFSKNIENFGPRVKRCSARSNVDIDLQHGNVLEAKLSNKGYITAHLL
jgi:hypothetical protein